MVILMLQITSRRWHYLLVLRNYSCLLRGLQTGIPWFFLLTNYIDGPKALTNSMAVFSVTLVYVELLQFLVSIGSINILWSIWLQNALNVVSRSVCSVQCFFNPLDSRLIFFSSFENLDEYLECCFHMVSLGPVTVAEY
jgi:hypothetical protein